MPISFDYIRPDKAESFDLEQFKTALEELTNFSDQLKLWNEYFNLAAMGKRLSIDDISGKVYYHFYCESLSCTTGISPFTIEKKETLINWRRNYFGGLKEEFDQLSSYKERIGFKIQHFDTALCDFTPEVGIDFGTMPKSLDKWTIYNQFIFEQREKQWLLSPDYDSNKLFANRKEQFNKRIIIVLHPEEELQKEIATIRYEYEQPSKKLDKESERSNMHIKTFRDRLSGYLLDFSKKTGRFSGIYDIAKFVEGEHAYRYYKYLVELKQNPNWLRDLINTIDTESIDVSSLFIVPEKRQDLYVALKVYVDLDEEGECLPLKELVINGKIPDKPIVVTCLQKDFGLTFYHLKAIPKQGAKALSEQLPKYFARNDRGKITKLSQSTLEKHLRGMQG